MPVLRNPLKATPQPQDGETERKAASGTRQVQRSPSYHDEHSMPTAIRDIFPPEEIPTGKLGGTQLRKLVARTQPEADTMPAFELVPVPAARSKPIPEPERSGRREVFFARRTAFAQHEEEFARHQRLRQRAAFAQRVDYARNVLKHGSIARRLTALGLVIVAVAASGWNLSVPAGHAAPPSPPVEAPQ